MTTITEIIPDREEWPDWAKEAFDSGQFFNVVNEMIGRMENMPCYRQWFWDDNGDATCAHDDIDTENYCPSCKLKTGEKVMCENHGPSDKVVKLAVCMNCLYAKPHMTSDPKWREKHSGYVWCVRYPDRKKKHNQYWCGEYVDRITLKPVFIDPGEARND